MKAEGKSFGFELFLNSWTSFQNYERYETYICDDSSLCYSVTMTSIPCVHLHGVCLNSLC